MQTTAKRPIGGFIQPLDGFCCGFHLDLGVKVTLMIHALTSFFYIFTCISNILLEMPTFGNKVTMYTQCLNCAWALATLPFIASGISGVRNHTETHLRVYLYWLILTVGFDLVLTAVYLAKTMCAKLPSFLVAEGGAFACGIMRVSGIAFIAMMFGFSFYAIFVVWSRCEELTEGASEVSFDRMIGAVRARKRAAIFEHKSGLFGTGMALPSAAGFPLMYGSFASPGLSGGGKIFSGTTHITEYPPPHAPHSGSPGGLPGPGAA